MDPKVVLALTWIVAGLVVAAYIWFVVWRYRVEKRKKQAETDTETAMSDAIARAAQRAAAAAAAAGEPVPTPVEPAATSAPSPSTASAPSPSAPASPIPAPKVPAPTLPMPTAPAPSPSPEPVAAFGRADATVAELLSGISLPHDLVPLTTMASRSNVIDRVSFWTDRAPADVVGPAFADQLEQLGYAVKALDPISLAATRGNDHLMVVIHPDGRMAIVEGQVGFSSVPEHAVVIEVWIPR